MDSNMRALKRQQSLNPLATLPANLLEISEPDVSIIVMERTIIRANKKVQISHHL